MLFMDAEKIAEKIRTFFKGEVMTHGDELAFYSHDASLFTVMPALAVAPRDSEDVKNLVAFVAREKAPGMLLSLTARAAGTDMSGGSLGEGIIVDFTRHLNRFIRIGENDATAQPGMYYRDFEAETLKKNLLLPSYPASREICTVGGMVANNSGGEKTLTYGKTEQFIRELKTVLRDGNEYVFRALSFEELEAKKKLATLEGDIYRRMHALIEGHYDMLKEAKPKVSKNSAGYYLWNVLDKEKKTFDLTKLLVGSQGTLGLNTEVTFRLIRPHTHSRLLVMFLKEKDEKILPQLINHVLEFHPESFESYDDHTFRVAMKLFPQIVKRMKGNIITLGLQFLPEFWAVVSGGMPKLILLAEFTGDTDEEARGKAERAKDSIAQFGLSSRVTSTPDEAKKYWVIRRESFSLLRQHMKKLRTAPFIDDLIVQPAVLPQFIPALYKLLDEYPLTYTVAGHMGDANFHIIPLMDLSDPRSKQIIIELGDKVLDLIKKFHGSITAEHNDGILRSSALPALYGPEVYALFEKTKMIFDPDNMFNPGKKVYASREYALEHMNAR